MKVEKSLRRMTFHLSGFLSYDEARIRRNKTARCWLRG